MQELHYCQPQCSAPSLMRVLVDERSHGVDVCSDKDVNDDCAETKDNIIFNTQTKPSKEPKSCFVVG